MIMFQKKKKTYTRPWINKSMPPGHGVQSGRLGLGTLARLQLQQHVLRDGGLACPTRTNGQTDRQNKQAG